MNMHHFFKPRLVRKKRNADSSSSTSSSSKKAKTSWVRVASYPQHEQFAGPINEFLSSDNETFRFVFPDECDLSDAKKLRDIKFHSGNMHGIEATDPLGKRRGKRNAKRNASILLTKIPIYEEEDPTPPSPPSSLSGPTAISLAPQPIVEDVSEEESRDQSNELDEYLDALEQPSNVEADDRDVGDVYLDALEQPSDAETGL